MHRSKLLYFTIIIVFQFSTENAFNDNSENFQNEEYIYDYNSILGPHDAERFRRYSPEETKAKFGDIIDKMDLNHNGIIEVIELKDWIRNVLDSVLNDDVRTLWKEVCPEDREKIDFKYYVNKIYGERNTSFHLKVQLRDERRWTLADLDNDTLLNVTEFFRFSYPEKFRDLRSLVAQETLEGMDTNNDSVIDVNEYIDDMFPAGKEAKAEWVRNERQNFGLERDLNKDGVMDVNEVEKWILPESYNRVDAEASHFMELADKDINGVLTKSEMLEKYKVFIPHHENDRFQYPEHEDL